jgi:outer membrane lipoprotein-sorting protein
VLTPYVIDHYRNGTQTSRINYDSVEFNKPIADSLFAKPASIKAVK